jgi:hypothetical protein
MIHKAELVAGFSWASVCLIPWFWLTGVFLVDTVSIVIFMFFLLMAILASTIQSAVAVEKNKEKP